MQLELDELKKSRITGEWKSESWEEEARKNNFILFGLEERNGETRRYIEDSGAIDNGKNGGTRNPGTCGLCQENREEQRQ
jgi:hypothetical protein